jgi:hypothetical protein
MLSDLKRLESAVDRVSNTAIRQEEEMELQLDDAIRRITGEQL